METWKIVPGYDGAYEVSSLGRLKSNANSQKRREKILQFDVNRRGYLRARLNKDGRRYRIFVHRLVALVFIGDPPTPTHTVNHKDGNKTNNSASNLEYMTRYENLIHAYTVLGRKTTAARGFTRGGVVSDDTARRIKSECNAGHLMRHQIAGKYGVSISTVYRITRNKSCYKGLSD